MLNTRDWYDEHGITLIAGDEVVKIDRARRRVIAAAGVEAPYDRLILATGSNPVVLPLPGKELPGVVTLSRHRRRRQDDRRRARATGTRS